MNTTNLNELHAEIKRLQDITKAQAAEIDRLYWRIGYALSELELSQDAEEFFCETLGVKR